jgi:hypothetical protein
VASLVEQERYPLPFLILALRDCGCFLAAEVRRHVGPGDKLCIYADATNDFNFYLERAAIPILAKPEQMAHLAGEQNFTYLLLREGKGFQAARFA